MRSINKTILNVLPDIPRWIEARSMLIRNKGIAMGFEEGQNNFPQGVLYQEDIGLGVIVGKPSADLIFQLSELADEIICPEDHSGHFSEAFEDWTYEGADLYQQKTTFTASINTAIKPAWLKQSDLDRAEGISKPLLDELQEELMAGTEIFFASADNQPASFCFACAKTESFWDVSIETITKFQRRGLARQCFQMAYQEMNRHSLIPIWAAVDSNTASKAMAENLGFEPKDRLMVFTRRT